MNLLESIAQGTASALVWVGLLWVVNLLRNRFVEGQLRRTLTHLATTSSAHSFGVQITNRTRYNLLVRSVTMIAPSGAEGAALIFCGSTLDFIFDEKPTRDTGHITIHEYVVAPEGRKRVLPPIGDPVMLSPYTTGCWLAHNDLFDEHRDFAPAAIHIAAAYTTLLGKPKVILVVSDTHTCEQIQSAFRKHRIKMGSQKPTDWLAGGGMTRTTHMIDKDSRRSM